MESYDKYKKSGIDWISNIPEHWRTIPLKFLGRLQNGSTPSSSEDTYWDGDIIWVTTDDLGKLDDKYIISSKRQITQAGYDSCGVQLAPKGSIVLSTRAPIGHIGILSIDACTNQGCKTIVPENIVSEYCYYALKTGKSKLESLGEGSTFKELPTSKLKSFKVPFPPILEQQTIVSYLDYKTAQIDKLISDKEKLIDLLNDERTAIINQAVTKGIDPDVPMKNSGVDWLGDIPEHWKKLKLKRVTNKITDGEHISPNFTETGVPFLSAKDIRERTINYDVDKFVSFEDATKSRMRCNPEINDILIVSRGATIGRVGYVEDDKLFCLLGSVILVKPSDKISSLFLYYLLSSFNIQQTFNLTSQSSAQQAIYLVHVSEIIIGLPPIDEQLKISKYLTEHDTKYFSSIKAVNNEIELLKEYKTALISEVVTGKVDVRIEIIPETENLTLASL